MNYYATFNFAGAFFWNALIVTGFSFLVACGFGWYLF